MSKRHYRNALALGAAASAALGVVAPTSASPATTDGAVRTSASPFQSGESVRERKGYYDARQVAVAGAVPDAPKAMAGPPAARIDALREAIGRAAVIDIDPLTGTPANVTASEGFLTGPSSASAQRVVKTYLKSHLRALGLTSADLGTMRLRRDYVDVIGTHHLSWTQEARGVTVFGNGLEAHVTKDGQLISVQGSPVAGLTKLTAGASVTPAISAESARAAAAKDVGGSVEASAAPRAGRTASSAEWSNGDSASLVWFATANGPRLAWSTYTQAGDTLDYAHVIDAATGAVLYRRDLVNHNEGDAKVYDYYPGAARGGEPKVVNLYDKGWLSRKASFLNGRYVIAWSDVDDDNRLDDKEKTPIPGGRKGAQFDLRPFNRANDELCGPRFICTWNANKRYSWRENRKADVTNAFYLANNFHDYLERGPVGFTTRAGNFERVDGDPVLLHALDGADTDNGFPDGNHVDNANMSTPPDGTPPTMQMYLWHYPRTPNSLDPFLPTTGGFDASILYHEYGHGLSNRLVVDAQGNSTLNGIQANAMGEAWSDWYAMDYLVAKGYQPDDRSKDGQVRVAKYVLANKIPFRTQAMDCDRRSTVAFCTDILGEKGGYTYGDFATIGGAPQVHASGEVWAQTLWDIRERLGHRVAAMLVTRGMELAANDPDMLDMRNAIIQADAVAYGGSHTPALWSAFARRGFGWYAGSIDAGDVQPAQDFHTPPSPARGYGTLSGTVTNRLTGDVIEGARVTITGHPEYTDRTDANGQYQIDFVKPGRYKKVVVATDGYEVVVARARVRSGRIMQEDFSTRRDWAAASGGGQIASYEGPDYTAFGCGPIHAIDLSQGTGWGSDTYGSQQTSPYPDPKSLVVKLPEPITLAEGSGPTSAFKVDPSATCGDPGSATTGDFTIEVSANAGGPWTTVASRQGEAEWLPRYQFTNVAATGAPPAGVQYVRFTIETPQVPDFDTNCPDGPYAGCVFMDLTELEVFGVPTNP